MRAINPDAAKSEGDAAARDARAKKILRETYKGEELKGKNVVPGLEERWDRPLEEHLGYFGQRQTALGTVRLYEFDFDGSRGRSYTAALTLPLDDQSIG